MRTFSEIIEYDNFFSSAEFDKMSGILDTHKWGFNQNSRPDYQPYKVFWIMNLIGNQYMKTQIFNTIKNAIGSNFKIKNIYANGQTSSQLGVPHVDSIESNEYTFLIYMNWEWDITWAGYTIFLNKYVDSSKREIFFDGENEIKVKTYFPVRNRCLLFPGNIVHYADAPSRDFYGLRKTIAFKLEKQEVK